MRFATLLLAAALFAPMPGLQAKTVLKDCVIYVPDKAPASVRLAGVVMQKYVKAATGNELEIVNKPAKKMIALGDSPEMRMAGINAPALKDEELRILTKDGSLYIAGKDYPGDRNTPYGGKSFGTLYGTYEFLDRYMGIRFLLPVLDTKGSGMKTLKKRNHIPEQPSDFAVDKIDFTYRPRITQRKSWTPYGTEMYLPNHEISAIPYGFAHSWGDLYPAKGNKKYAYLKDREQTFQEHPEYFQMAPNGQRIAPQTRSDLFSLCLSNPDVLKDVAERVLLYAEKTGNRIIAITPNDATPTCSCKNCQASVEHFTEEEAGPTENRGGFESWTPLVLNYYKTVSESVQKKRPDLILTGSFYYKYEFPPKNGRKIIMPGNFSPNFWLLHTSYGPVRYYDPLNANYHRWIKRWMEYFPNSTKGYGKYDFWYRHGNGMLPPAVKYLEEIRQNILKYNFTGARFEPSGSVGSVPDGWICARLAWNPDIPVETLYTDWLESSFGKEAAPHVRKIYDLIEAGFKKHVDDHKGFVGYNMNADLMADGYGAHWPEIEACYKKALKAKKNKFQQWRLENSFGLALRLTGYHVRCMNLGKVTKDSPLYLDDEGIAEINERRTLSTQDLWGVLPYTSVWSVSPGNFRPVTGTDVSGKIPCAKEFRSASWFHSEDFVILADRDGVAELKLEWETNPDPFTGKKYRPEIPYFTAYDGKTVKTISSGCMADNGAIRFRMKKGQTILLNYLPLYEYRSGARWRIVSMNMPYAMGHSRQPSGLYINDMKEPMYFRIKEGTKQFELTLHRGGFDVDFVSPDGKVAKHVAGSEYCPVRIENPAAGWWMVRPGKKRTSCFIRQGKGMSGYFVYDPNHAFDAECLKK